MRGATLVICGFVVLLALASRLGSCRSTNPKPEEAPTVAKADKTDDRALTRKLPDGQKAPALPMPAYSDREYGEGDVDIQEFDKIQKFIRDSFLALVIENASLQQQNDNLKAALRWTVCSSDFKAGGALEKEWHQAVGKLLDGPVK